MDANICIDTCVYIYMYIPVHKDRYVYIYMYIDTYICVNGQD